MYICWYNVRMKLVVKLKLVTDKESDRLLREVTEQYRLACNHISYLLDRPGQAPVVPNRP